MANGQIGFDSFLPFGQLFSLFRSGVRGAYRFGYQILHSSTQFNQYASEKEKLVAVLSNPAALKVFALQCDLFSLGKVYVKDADDKEIEDDPFLGLIKKPNPFQTQSQMLWDYMFWLMLGTSYCYVDSKVIDQKNKVYFLDPCKIYWPPEFDRQRDKLVFSDDTIKKIGETELTYRYDDGTTFKFPLKKLVISTDLTNGLGNWYKGPSRLDALYKVVSNSEHALDSKNINLRYAGKFLVGAPNETSKIGMGEAEKKDLEEKIDTDDKKVWPMKTMVQIRRFVEDFKSLELGKSYLEDYFIIGSMYGIPRDVLEAYNSSTYENQEKARAAHVNYCFEPKGNQFMNSFEVHFGYNSENKNICIDWCHLPFMQVFEKEKTEIADKKVDTFTKMINLKIKPEAANAYLGTNFEVIEEEEIIEENSDPETKAAQAALRGSVGGVQGILSIQQSVVQGVTEYESAISILTIIYGFTEQQAKDILGQPKQQSNGQQEGNAEGGQEGTGGSNQGQEQEVEQ